MDSQTPPPNSSDMESTHPDSVKKAFEVFGLNPPLTKDQLEHRYHKLRHTWHPHRYANLTNNPQKYMQMYKKGETKSNEVKDAFRILVQWMDQESLPPSPH